MKITSLKNLAIENVFHNPAIKKKVMLRLGELPHLTNFSQAQFPPGEIVNAHAHQDMCEVFFVEAGAGIIRIDGQEYPFQKGTCVVVQPREVHEIINTGATELVVTYFGLLV